MKFFTGTILKPEWKNILYIPVPKTGGSYILSHFQKKWDNCFYRQWSEFVGHFTYRQVAASFKTRNIEIKDFITTAIVRNPWDWHVSFFHYIKQAGPFESGLHVQYNILKEYSFEDYVMWLNDHSAWGIDKDYNHRQICDWLKNDNGEIAVDNILRQENLNDDFDDFIQRYGLKIKQKKTLVNKSKRKSSYQDYYTSKTKNIIGDRHQDDIKIFDYSF